MSLEIGIRNHEKSKYGAQIGLLNKTAYPQHLFQLGGFNESKGFVGIQTGISSNDSGRGGFIKDFYGLQAGMMNFAQANLYGLQTGAINESNFRGMQFGGVNFGFEDCKGVQLGLINLGGLGPKSKKERAKGAQFGGINIAEALAGAQVAPFNYTQRMGGAQLGLMDIVTEEFHGFQLGVVCYAAKGNYFQLGALTLRKDENLPWYKKISPVLGWHREK